MRIVCTTHQVDVFKLFYTHNLHDIFIEDLILYVDNYDSKDFEDVVDLSKTKVYNRHDLEKYYSHFYNDHLKTFKKVYLINMLLELGDLEDGFYFTDDDVLLFDRIDEIKNYDYIVYDHEVSNMSNVFVGGWKVIDDFRIKYTNVDTNKNFSASNFLIPKSKIQASKKWFKKLFYEFMYILIADEEYIDKVCTKTRSLRKCSVLVFYLDALFLNTLYSNVFDGTEKPADYRKPTYRHIRGIKEKINSTDASLIWQYFREKTKSNWPKGQPLFHFVVTNKVPLMTEFYKALNNEDPTYDNIDDLLMLNPKEKSKLLKDQKTRMSKDLTI